MSSIAKKFGGGASHIITPKHWTDKKIWLLTDEEYRDLIWRTDS